MSDAQTARRTTAAGSASDRGKTGDRVSDSQVVAALLDGADSRTAIDPRSLTNKYLCRPTPMPGVACFASCTASPIGAAGFAQARAVTEALAGAASPQRRADILAAQQARVTTALARYFGLDDLATVLLCPSGTDALLTAAVLLAQERPGAPMTAILPAAAETGAGVALATTCRRFDGPARGTRLAPAAMHSVEVALRDPDGTPRDPARVTADYLHAMTTARGRALLVVTHGTKTGLVAPLTPPPAAVDVIVDAAQARLSPARVRGYLRRGWPVIVTGSKFFGGPAFSGAVLFPKARRRMAAPAEAGLGTLLRWTAALDIMIAFAARCGDMADFLAPRMQAITQGMTSHRDIVPIEGIPVTGARWDEQPSILTFAVRDPAHPARLLTAAELQPLYRRLASAGCLLGQPVGLGTFGGLRIAVGARDLLDEAPPVSRLLDALHQATEATLAA